MKRYAPTPYLSDQDKEYDDSNEAQGTLKPIASKVIMNIFYGEGLSSGIAIIGFRVAVIE